MANDNVVNTNKSQFFITLDAAEWLNKKHTIFGKISGTTIFNVLRMGETETDPDTDRPLEPPRLLSVEILAPPFDDIVPRDIAKTSVDKVQAKEETERQEKKRKRPKTKNLGLSRACVMVVCSAQS